MKLFRSIQAHSQHKDKNPFHLEPSVLDSTPGSDQATTQTQEAPGDVQTPVTTFRAEPIHSIDEVGKHRTWEAYRYFNRLVETEERVVQIGKQFGRLGFVLQAQLLKTIPTVTKRTKQVFVEITTTSAMETMTEYRYCRPARLVSALMGCPDEAYNEKEFIADVLKPFGARHRDWTKLSTADLFATRSELVGSLHYFTPWGEECYAVFDLQASAGPEVVAERERKQHVFMTNKLARQILYKYSEELQLLYELVAQKLDKCSATLARYGSSEACEIVLPYEEHVVYH